MSEQYGEIDGRYRARLDAGTRLYEQGAVAGALYLVMSGRVVFEAVDGGGARAVVHEAGPEEWFGHVSALSGRPTSASATVLEPAELLTIPIDEATAAFGRAPALAVSLLRQFAANGRPGGNRSAPCDVDDVGADTSAAHPQQAAAPRSRSGRPRSVPLDAAFNAEWFFADDVICPVCESRFEYLRVRTEAVKPTQPDTDFRIQYLTVDPTHYSVIVCPACSYAAYSDDFEQLDEAERRSLAERAELAAARTDEDGQDRPQLCGERSLDDAAVALDLAIACYAVRRPNDRRRAGLLHRRAWLERAREDRDAELPFLRATRDAYARTYEQDGTLPDDAAFRAAYLVGEISMRLGEYEEAARWLLKCVQMDEVKRQPNVARLARDRLIEAREARPRGSSAA